MQVRIKVLETIKGLQEGIDGATMKSAVFKSFERVRGREKDNDPQVSMLML